LEKYKSKKRQYQNFCNDRKEELKKEEEEKIRKIRTEAEA